MDAATTPGPPALRSVSLRRALYLQEYIRDPLALVSRRFAAYGDVYCVRVGSDPLFVTRHPDAIRQVLVTDASRFEKRDPGLKRFLGEGLFTAEGEVWRRHRRMIQPGFGRQRIADYGDAMVETTRRHLGQWREGQTLELRQELTGLTLAVVCEALFSHALQGEARSVGAAMTVFQETLGRPDPIPDWIPTPYHRNLRSAAAEVDGIVYALLDRRRDSGATRHDDLVQMLLDARDEAGAPLTREEIRDELVTFFLAGHETTANGLVWTFHLLADHPHVERRLRAELHDRLGDRDPAVNDLPDLPYLAAVVDESLRHYPPAYALARNAIEHVTLEVGDERFDLAPGQPIVTWIWHAHHDARFFRDPFRFEPRRFLPGAPPIDRHAYLPFGLGARKCIGAGFARMEMQLLLGTILRRWHFDAPTGRRIPTAPRITLTPGKPVTVRARRV